jgi:hypothetical protein
VPAHLQVLAAGQQGGGPHVFGPVARCSSIRGAWRGKRGRGSDVAGCVSALSARATQSAQREPEAERYPRGVRVVETDDPAGHVVAHRHVVPVLVPVLIRAHLRLIERLGMHASVWVLHL